jgi:hypothetical protein
MDDSRQIEHRTGPITREFIFSPCYDSDGDEYHLVVVQGRHGSLRHSPLRCYGTGVSVDLARAKAMAEFTNATTSLRRARDVSAP